MANWLASGWARWALTLLMLPVLGVLLAIGGELVPDRRVASVVADEVRAGDITQENRTKTFLGYTVDHHSECLGLTVGLDSSGRNLVEVALASPTLGNCGSTFERMSGWESGDPIVPNYDYLRYWHGHTVVLKPAFAVGGVEAVRGLGYLLLAGSAAALFWVLRRHTSTIAALLFLAPLLISTDLLVTPRGGPHGVAAATVFAAAALTLEAVTRKPTLWTVATMSSLAAGLLVLVDVFTMGTVSLVTTTSFVGIAFWSRGSKGIQLLGPMAVAAAAWCIGYVTTWVSKWVLAGSVIGYGEVWDRISSQVAFRTQGEVDYIDLGLGNTTRVVVQSWLDTNVGMLTTMVAAIWVLMAAIKASRTRSWPTLLVLYAPALLSLFWFEIMQNHTQVHRWFTGPRGVGIALAVVLLASEVVRKEREAEPSLSQLEREAPIREPRH